MRDDLLSSYNVSYCLRLCGLNKKVREPYMLSLVAIKEAFIMIETINPLYVREERLGLIWLIALLKFVDIKRRTDQGLLKY